MDVRLGNNKKDYVKLTSKPRYVTHKLLENNLIAIPKVTLSLNKPAHVGMCILDLSKVLMYEFHYDYIKNRYGKKS